ncbi:hypothetical protein BCV70DRAFT_168236, partial [Testicularia cyperi]
QQQHQQAPQQQAGYYSHHPSSQHMDPNGQLYGVHQIGHPDMMAGGQFGSHHDMMAHQHGYAGLQGAGIRPKRKQVKNACVNCQKACKKCDEGRPCSRCVKYGLTDTCQDSARKERRRGIKRGPYKRRATTGSQPNGSSLTVPGSMSGYGRDGHISPSSRSDGMVATPGTDSNFSSPAFNTQVLAPRPAMPLQMPSQQWQSGAAAGAEDREGLRARYGQAANGQQQGSYYGYEQDPSHHGYDRSSSAPIAPQGSMLSPVGRFPNTGTPQSQTSQLPSLMSGPTSSSSSSYLGGVYGNGQNGRVGAGNGSTSSLISPPLHSSSGSGFLSASSGPNGIAHHRLHSDSSLATLSSAGASSSTMSPRTPLNGPGSDQPLMSPSGNKMSGFTPPQPTVPPVSGAFLQDPNRPFPLKMPKAPQRGRSGTGNGYMDQQAPAQRYENVYGQTNNLAPIGKREPSPHHYQRSSPYIGIQAMDDRRQQFGNTPRMDLSPNPGMMSLRTDKDMAGPPPPAPAGSLGLA